MDEYAWIFNLSMVIVNFIIMLIGVLTWNSNKRKIKIKFCEEMMVINNLSITYPILRKLYEIDDGVKLSSEDNERIRSLCYKYLNLLEMFTILYPKLKRYNSPAKIRREMNKEKSFLGGWLWFYHKAFKENTRGYLIIKEIIDGNEDKGDYPNEFIEFLSMLIKMKYLHQNAV